MKNNIKQQWELPTLKTLEIASGSISSSTESYPFNASTQGDITVENQS